MAEFRRMRPLLGTFVEVGVRGGPQVDKTIEAAFAALEQAQARWSFHDAGSELSRLNRRPGERIELSAATLRLLRAARTLMHASGGAFDCTVGGTLVRDGNLPDHGGPEALPHGEAADIDIGPGWALLRRPVRVTLDGVAKGFAVDIAIGALRRHGARAGWINAGGDLRVFGDVTLPVQRREFDGRNIALGELREAALATSAVVPDNAAETSFPGRIVTSRSVPPEPGVWTVLARSAWRADALTKVAACVPAERRATEVARLGGCLIGATP